MALFLFSFLLPLSFNQHVGFGTAHNGAAETAAVTPPARTTAVCMDACMRKGAFWNEQITTTSIGGKTAVTCINWPALCFLTCSPLFSILCSTFVESSLPVARGFRLVHL
ncbi:hypothetical protein BC567DRAFT_3503 [Phyllosticta citribraziliensis]